VAFIFSIAITNVVGAFIDEVMERGGVTDRRSIAWAGCGFELAIVFGGVILGKYVDRTKEYKKVTNTCILLSLVFLLPLGLTEHRIGKEPKLLVASLLCLGFFVGPVQPINAELAVDVTYPADETAVESVQQFGGNFCSALLVPVAGRAAKLDYQLLPKIPLLASDIRGDVIFMMALSVAAFLFYRSFNAPLRRSIADGFD
jgi:FLVCR family feline leukemia virus subgroup C receptor-related protein